MNEIHSVEKDIVSQELKGGGTPKNVLLDLNMGGGGDVFSI